MRFDFVTDMIYLKGELVKLNMKKMYIMQRLIKHYSENAETKRNYNFPIMPNKGG